MAEPLLINVGVLVLLRTSVRVTVLLKTFLGGVYSGDPTSIGLLSDVQKFQEVLQSIKEAFDRDDLKSTAQAAGAINNHVTNIARSLEDGTFTLQELTIQLEAINKKASFADSPREQNKYRAAVEQISVFRVPVQCYRDVLRSSLDAIFLRNQLDRYDTMRCIPENFHLRLNKLNGDIQTIGAHLSEQSEHLKSISANRTEKGSDLGTRMNDLQKCLRSATEVISTGSRAPIAEMGESSHTGQHPDSGNAYPKEANLPIMRWMASHSLSESGGTSTLSPNPPELEISDDVDDDQSDSDAEIEKEVILSLFNEGKKRQQNRDLTSAVKLYQNCLTRLSSGAALAPVVPLHSASTLGVSKIELLDSLVECYCLLESWSLAKPALVEKLSIVQRQVGRKDERVLWDTLKLARILAKIEEYPESHFQARRSLRGFKRMGELGHQGYEQCLQFLIELCRIDANEDEEQGYAVLLSHHMETQISTHPTLQGSQALPSEIHGESSTSKRIAQQTSAMDSKAPDQIHDITLQSSKLDKDFRMSKPESNRVPMPQHISHSNSRNPFLRKLLPSESEAKLPPEPDEESAQAPGAFPCSKIPQLHDVITKSGERVSPDIRYELEANQDFLAPTAPDSFFIRPAYVIEAQNTIFKIAAAAAIHRDKDSYRERKDPSSGKEVYQPDYNQWTDQQPTITPKASISHPESAPEVYAGHDSVASGLISVDLEIPAEDAPKQAMSVICPVCSISLGHLPEDKATRHVNDCLDDAAILPLRSRNMDAPDLASLGLNRYNSHLATSTNTNTTPSTRGVWACSTCKSKSLLYMNEPCGDCHQIRIPERDPSSSNGFQRNPFDCFRTSLTFYEYSVPVSTEDIIPQRKIVLLGDAFCGKSCLIRAWSQDRAPEMESPWINKFVKSMTVNDLYRIEMSVWDGPGRDDLLRLRHPSYSGAHVVLICFDISDENSFDKIEHRWNTEADRYLPRVPKILVGCKKDRRNDDLLVQSLRTEGRQPVSPYAGDALAARIQALAYFETSASRSKDLDELFNYVAEASIKKTLKKKERGLRRFLSRSENKPETNVEELPALQPSSPPTSPRFR